jgi:hypothetical protein
MIASSRKSLPTPTLEKSGKIWDKVQQLLAASCLHRHLTQPFSAVSSNRLHSDLNEGESISQSQSRPYVVCLDCGRHFAYDWSQMRVIR